MMQSWIKAASSLPYTDDVCGSVVTALLGIASIRELSLHIPMAAWDWLNKRPVLPPECVALLPSTARAVVEEIQRLRDVKLIVSCLHILWSEWRRFGFGPESFRDPNSPWCDDTIFMRQLIWKELGGIGAAGYRTDLIRRLGHVLLQLDQGYGMLSEKWRYDGLRGGLLEIDERAMEILTGTSSSRHPPLSTDSHVHVQDVILPSCAHFLFRAHS